MLQTKPEQTICCHKEGHHKEAKTSQTIKDTDTPYKSIGSHHSLKVAGSNVPTKNIQIASTK